MTDRNGTRGIANPVARCLVLFFAVALLSVACGPSPRSVPSSTAAAPTAAGKASASAPASAATGQYALGNFPEPPAGQIADKPAAALQAIVDAAVDGGLPGMSATVMAADVGVWTGVAGTADGERPIDPGSQFGIASLTKTVIAAQVIRLSESGLVRLRDPVSDHLPQGFRFDTNGATIENLLAMESGIPDPTLTSAEAAANPARRWTPEEILATVPADRSKPGDHFVYEDSNYMLLGMVIEEVTGTSVATALRADILAEPRLATLVYQPDERPEGPLALPFGEARESENSAVGGSYVPSAALASSGNGSGCMAADSPSLALFGYLLFGGSLVSDASLQAMTDFGSGADYDRYGLGVFEQTDLAGGFDAVTVGNGGWDEGGYSSVLAVMPDQGVAISVMTNTAGDPVELVVPVAQELAAVLAASSTDSG